MSEDRIGIGLIGCGTVGQGVAKLLSEQGDWYARKVGRPLAVRRVLVRNPSAKRDCPLDGSVFTDDPEKLFGDEGISIVVEVAGGIDEAGEYVRRALESGRHVVTANKALLARHGVELCALAHRRGCCIAFEGSCAGGIPVLAALKFGLAANRIHAVYGILNGTSNYILTQMAERGASYAEALAEAQAQGYAEADPTLDVGGGDAAQKLAIISSLAFGASVDESDVSCEGIDRVDVLDIRHGAELGYQMKLLAVGELRDGAVALRVQPCFVHHNEPLAQVRLADNALSVYGDAVGHTMYYGPGAGQMPTASAVVGDLLNVAGGWYPQAFASMRIWPDQHEPVRLLPADEVNTRYYLRIDAPDRSGELSRIAGILGEHGISICSVLQHETANDGGFVPVVITTYRAAEGAVERAAQEMVRTGTAQHHPVCIRIVDLPAG